MATNPIRGKLLFSPRCTTSPAPSAAAPSVCTTNQRQPRVVYCSYSAHMQLLLSSTICAAAPASSSAAESGSSSIRLAAAVTAPPGAASSKALTKRAA
eukprot:1084324-Prymnesium_polylepis.2